MKEGINILKITKTEAFYLASKGVKYGDGGISKTNSCHHKLHTYYLTESKKNMLLLNRYRKSVIVK